MSVVMNRASRRAAADLAGQVAAHRPPCSGDGLAHVFLSPSAIDHRLARQLCGPCPARGLCLQLGHAEPLASGTYGGRLFHDGVQVR